MAMCKMTFLINWGQRCGWTETFYKDVGIGSGSQSGQRTAANAWADQRAGCLTAKATIIGCRISVAANPREVYLVGLTKPGVLGKGWVLDNDQGADVPNVAQLVTFSAQGGAKRIYLQRGLGDNDVNNGIIDFKENGKGPYTRFWDYIQNFGYCMRDYTPQESKKLLTINNQERVALFTAAPGFVDRTLITVHTRNAGNGLKVYWTGRCGVPAAAAVPLRGWHIGDCEGGVAFEILATYPDLVGWAIPEPNYARTRQTGRPFGLPRGRQLKRT